MGSVARTAVIASTASAVARAQRTAAAESERRERADHRTPSRRVTRAAAEVERMEHAERVVGVLKQLTSLRDQGALTEEEFAAEKARLLA
jgi:hypothetical protein